MDRFPPEMSQPVVLLGAGASAEAGVPTSFDMTQRIVDAVNGGAVRYRSLAQSLNFVCGALVAYDAADGGNPFTGLDVERVFAAIDLLARRRSLEVTPFVSAWHPAVEAWDRPRNIPGWDSQFQKAVIEPRGFRRPQESITELIKVQTGPGDGETYEALQSHMVAELVTLLRTTPEEVVYLAPLVAQGRRQDGVTIATLNYDLSVEQACGQVHIAGETGISHWADTGSWDWPESGVRLLKLHGSIDWAWDERHGESGRLPDRRVVPLDEPVDDQRPPALVFGHGAKLRADGPFLSLLGEFESFLTAAEELVVIGYSFRDAHINEIVRRWFIESPTARITLVEPHFRPKAVKWNDRGTLADELAHYFRDSDRFRVVNEVASLGLKAVFPGA